MSLSCSWTLLILCVKCVYFPGESLWLSSDSQRGGLGKPRTMCQDWPRPRQRPFRAWSGGGGREQRRDWIWLRWMWGNWQDLVSQEMVEMRQREKFILAPWRLARGTGETVVPWICLGSVGGWGEEGTTVRRAAAIRRPHEQVNKGRPGMLPLAIGQLLPPRTWRPAGLPQSQGFASNGILSITLRFWASVSILDEATLRLADWLVPTAQQARCSDCGDTWFVGENNL